MTMKRSTSTLIDAMAAELEPVKPLRLRDGVVLVTAAAAVTLIAVALLTGLWRGIWDGTASAFFFTTNGLLLVLGCASAASVLRMARPRVGNHHDGPRWASLMVAVLPFAALVSLAGHEHGWSALAAPHGLECLGAGLLASTLSAGALFAWLRRGAPVAPATAGLYLGIASTSLGSAAYGLACPLDGAVHLGIWHVAPVAIGALIGRFLVARLLRW
jgi:hypothetical protein